jgi:hypothetical protein
VFQDITNWNKGTEHINGLELFFKDRDHLIEKWETLRADGTKGHFEFELTRKTLTPPPLSYSAALERLWLGRMVASSLGRVSQTNQCVAR